MIGIMRKKKVSFNTSEAFLAATLLDNILFCNEIIIQNTTENCTNYLISKEDKGILQIIIWSPPQYTDLSPVELTWDEIDRKVRRELT